MPNQKSEAFKSRSIRIVVAALLMLVALPGGVTAQRNNASVSAMASNKPEIIQFNGTLVGAASKTVSISFALYENKQGGTALWSETDNVQVNAQGNYTALLGASSPLNLFPTDQTHWLAVRPLLKNFSDQPRVLLVSVKYIPRSADVHAPSTLLDSDSEQAAKRDGGGTGPKIQTVAFSHQFVPRSAYKSFFLASPAVPAFSFMPSSPRPASCQAVTSSSGGTTGSVAFFDAPCDIQSSIITELGVNVGIGTAAPLATLDVNGTIGLPPTTGANSGVITIGGAPFLHDFGGGANTFVGVEAGNFNSNNTGLSNTALGATALFRNTTGGSNTAVGELSLSWNTSGSFNTAVGQAAGNDAQNSITGSYNTFIGYHAVPSTTNLTNATAIGANAVVSQSNSLVLGGTGANAVSVGIGTATPAATLDVAGTIGLPATTGANSGVITVGGLPFLHEFGGRSNTFLGDEAGNFNASNTGATDTAAGSEALHNNTSGRGNTALGASALVNNTTGGQNTATGTLSLSFNTAGIDNTAIGLETFPTLTTGNGNTALGAYAGGAPNLPAPVNNQGPSTPGGTNNMFNTFIGYYAGGGIADQLTNATAIGANALVSESNALVLGGTGANAVNVGIGQTIPYSLLHIRKDATSTLGPSLTLMNGGGSSGAGASIDFDGYDPGPTNAPAARIQSIDDGSDSAHLTFLTKVPGAQSNSLMERLRITSNGAVGIGTTGAPSATLEVNGPAQFDAGVTAAGSVNPDFGNVNAGSLNPGITFGKLSGEGISSNRGAGVNTDGLDFYTAGNPRLSITNNGWVGIGTQSPVNALEVKGPAVFDDGALFSSHLAVDGFSTFNGSVTVSNSTGPAITAHGDLNSAAEFDNFTSCGAVDCTADIAPPTLVLSNPNPISGGTLGPSMFFAGGGTLTFCEFTIDPAPSQTCGGTAGGCVIDSVGNLFCSGNKSAVVPVDHGSRQVALYAVEAPENWFEDAGSGKLTNGSATVVLESTFSKTVNTSTEYHVFLTPEGDCEGLYVTNKTPTGFDVRELHGGHSNIDFDYRIMAHRAGHEKVRLEDKTGLFNRPTPKGASPAGVTPVPTPNS